MYQKERARRFLLAPLRRTGTFFSPDAAKTVLNLRDDFTSARLHCVINDSIGDLVVHQRVETGDISSKGLQAGQHCLRVGFPPLWLAPSVYSLYFKFIGRRASGTDERYVSERMILDVAGDLAKIGKARPRLSPQLEWTLTHTSQTVATDTVEPALHGWAEMSAIEVGEVSKQD